MSEVSQELREKKWLLNTNTGCLFIQTGRIDAKPHLQPYKPTDEEILTGRKAEAAVEPAPAAEEESEAAPEPEAADPVETEVVIPAAEEESEAAPAKPATRARKK